jgi:hypothetical protein
MAFLAAIPAAIAAIGSTIGGATAAAGAATGITASGLSTALGAIGTGVSAISALSAGKQAKAEANFLAQQQEMKGNEERAVGQQKMLRKRADAERVQSSLMARAAASGGDTTDTGLVRLGGDIAEEGEFQALNEFARGENAARGFMDQATATRARGAAAARAAPIKAVSTILDGGSSLFGKYAKGFA